MSSQPEIDEDLYSRQIGAFGLETMGKLVKMRVLISGLRGTGVETAKNLILAGPNTVVLHDDSLVEARDMGSNFYVNDKDVGVTTRAQASYRKLQELNSYVNVRTMSGPLGDAALSDFDVVVLCDVHDRDERIRIDNYCRQHGIGSIATDIYGLAGRIFVDYGDKFIVHDKDGEECRTAIVSGITQDEHGEVITYGEQRHGFHNGDYVTFSEIEGMTELNGCDPVRIKVTGPYSFSIDKDTRNFHSYTREGIATQVKMPEPMKFISLEESEKNPVPPNEGMLPVPDLGKFGRSEQLHLALMGLERAKPNGGARSDDIYKAVLEATKAINNERKANSDELSVDEVDESVVRHVAYFYESCISPMAAFAGGVVAQEVVKYTGKFTPLHQSLYWDMFELVNDDILNSKDMANFTDATRYEDYVSIMGKKNFDKVLNSKIFLVGAGALGCEFLKAFSSMGVGCGPEGKVTVTDNDRIEISNLNRQFLFRKQHVGKQKSITAAKAAKEMNPALNVKAIEVRVGPETEDILDDNFWESQSCMVNALDNIAARLYVDSRCVWYEKPLMESGTLGTKANVQVVLPNVTQSYGDSQDPPEDSIPLCTLKHFPYAIEHTIEWARDQFQGLFTEAPQEVLTYLKDPTAYVDKVLEEGATSVQKDKLESVKKFLSKDLTMQHCVNLAVDEFTDKYDHAIAQLLYNFPLDHKNSDGNLFWSGPKRPPQVIHYDPNDELHLSFVYACANLYATVLGIPVNKDKEQVRDMSKKCNIEPFMPRNMKIKVSDDDTSTDESAPCMDDEEAVEALANQMRTIDPKLREDLQKRITPAEFEKDDDTNFHIDFIAASANLRARNYKIKEADRNKVKMIAGKIIPAIATTTAMVTGMVSCELLKVLMDEGKYDIEKYKNSFVNLALPTWILSEPLPPVKTVSKDYDPIAMGPVRAKPEGFTPWMKLVINHGPEGTLRELVDWLAKEQNVEVMILSSGNACLYNAFLPAHKKRLDEKMPQLYEQITKQKIPVSRNYLVLEVSACDLDDQVDTTLPTIKYIFR
ncbi:hypothetical protein FOL47_004423 [Perkinsus chesapeaki]|uniref:E1 ubiquitin-activating enzyme n=1 Tax=Perkinsus chesapeaki TaxID=330153 RepID=A0A7J6M2R6_PERCH|nr:hypothetical protein FOL47_004423 [Perkinsus chesapeaki]